MSDIIKAYESVSVHEIERILEFVREAWLLGFPVVKKEDGRSKEQLLTQAALLLLVSTGCITGEHKNDIKVVKQVEKDIKQGGRLSLDAMDFMMQVRSAKRYTRKSVMLRKQQAGT